jgi:hypothetical protein
MNTPVPSEAAGRIKLYHQRHGRRQMGKALGHIAPAAVLVSSVLDVVSGKEVLSWLTGLEFVVGAAYLLLMVRELLHLRHNPHHQERVAWLELAAAGILFLEGYHSWHRHHEANLARGTHTVHLLPYCLCAVALFFVVQAFTLSRFHARRHLHLHEEGFSGRLHPLGRAFEFRWADIAVVEPVGPADLLVLDRDGRRHRYSFQSLHDGPAHRDRLLAHALRLMKNEE